MVKELITPEDLHNWYLEAVSYLDDDFNIKAVKPYLYLSEKQQFIDKFIAKKINKKFLEKTIKK